MDAFNNSKIKIAVPQVPSLTLASLAAPLLKAGHYVKILDLSIKNNLPGTLKNFNPDYVGITSTTFLFNEVIKISELVKKHNKNIKIIIGGSHPSALPKKCLKDSKADIVMIGEGDYRLLSIVNGKNLKQIEGIYYKKANKILYNKYKGQIEDLNSLPFPAWELFDLSKYKSPKLTAKKSPVGPIETSRGCIFNCKYCNKSVFGRKFRTKSINRVVDEMAYMLNIGFKEIYVYDDCFTIDIKRAKKICDEIIRRKLKFNWNLCNGIRVDTVDKELFKKMKQAGCYRISFGIESGEQKILDRINKGITLKQIKKSIKLAKKAGIETLGFFMIGLPGDTIKSMEKTIKLAKELEVDIPKVGIMIPFPGTPIYDELNKGGVIKSKNWDYYNYHNPSKIYNHELLNWNIIKEYYNKFYRKTYLNFGFIFRRFLRGLKTGELPYDIYYFLKTLKYGW